MKIVKKLKIAYRTHNIIEDIQYKTVKIPVQGRFSLVLPDEPVMYNVFFEFQDTVMVNGKVFEVCSKPLGLIAGRFSDQLGVSYLEQLNQIANSIRLPERVFVDRRVKEEYYQDLYESVHPELDIVRETRKVPSPGIENLIIPSWCEKVVTYLRYSIDVKVSGSNTVYPLHTEKMFEQRYFVGNHVRERDGQIVYCPKGEMLTFENGEKVEREAYANPDDIIIDPVNINELGEVHI